MLGDVFEIDRRRRHQRVLTGQPELAAGANQDLMGQPLQVRCVGDNRQAQVKVAIAQGFFNALAVHVDEVDLDLRVTAFETGQQCRQKITEYGVGGTHAHGSLHGMAKKQRLAERVLQGVEDVPRMLGKLVAFSGQ
ncbi:hypothetical protein D3C85_725160 [compost metagenome]